VDNKAKEKGDSVDSIGGRGWRPEQVMVIGENEGATTSGQVGSRTREEK